MIEGSGKAYCLIIISVIIAMLMTILPLPEWAAWFWPQWVTLIVIYWALVMPERLGVITAWLIGLLLDAVHGTLLGEHALALVIVTYFVVKFHHRIQLYNFFQRTFIVFGLVLLYQAILFLCQILTGHMPMTWLYWISSVTSAIFWPWIYNLFQSIRRRFKLLDNGMRRFSYGRN